MTSRFLKLLIALSLLANVLLLGVTFGHMGRSFMGWCKPHEMQHHRINVHDLLSVLPGDKQLSLEQPVAHYDHDAKQLADRLADERKKLVALSGAKPFDKEAYLAQVKVINDLHAQMASNVSDIVTQIAGLCTDEERQQLSGKLSGMILDKQPQ